MKNLQSSPNIGKRFALLSLFSLFVFCAPGIFAQNTHRQQVSSAERQPETEHSVDFEVVFEQNRIAEESEDSTAKISFTTFSPTRFESENHGIVEVFGVKTTTETKRSESAAKPEFFAFRGGEKFFLTRDGHGSPDNQSEVDVKAKSLTSVGENPSFAHQSAKANDFDKRKNSTDDSAALDSQNGKDSEGFRWRPAIQQALLFLAVQHGYAMTQPKTREALKGRFFHDYIESVKSLRGWADGGRFFTNYIAHPMQGSFVGFIQIQNDPKGMKQRFGGSGDYWRSRMKAMAWSAVWSTQFEIGPLSQASIGNVGLKGKQTYVDLVMTPTLGTAMLISEDALDRFVIERIERGTNNFYLTIFSRMLLNPTRTVANLIRFKHPWYRDRSRAR